MRQEQYKKAEPLFIKEKNIIEKFLGKENSRYAQCVYNLGLLYLKTRQYSASEPLLKEAKNIQRELPGKDVSNYVEVFRALCQLYLYTGDHEKFKSLDLERREILKSLFEGTKDFTPDYYGECGIYAEQGNTEKALVNLEVAFINGFKDLENLQNNLNINNIRNLPQFRILLEKYFTMEDLAKYPKIFVIKWNLLSLQLTIEKQRPK